MEGIISEEQAPKEALATGSLWVTLRDNMTSLIRYDAAQRALAAAQRVDEVEAIRDKAEAVRVYAKQAGDFELQNQAAEIRIRAERRAGELLVDIQTSGDERKVWPATICDVLCDVTLPC